GPRDGAKQAGIGAAEKISFEALLEAGDEDFPATDMSPDAAAFWLYSSGTTGFPKGAIHLHQDAQWIMPFAREVLGVDEDCRLIASSKMFFAYGLASSMLVPLMAGGTAVLSPERSTPELMASLAIRHQPTLFFSVPSFYAAALKAGVPAGAYASVSRCVSAGEGLPISVYRAWREATGKEIVEHIGSTEFGYAFISNRPGQVRPGSSGKPVPGVEARIVDEAGYDAPDGEAGELLVKGGSTAIGYWNKREQTKRTFVGEWLRTGDVYSRDADGFYWNHGRVDDMLKVSGIWVSPIEVEQVLLEHEAVEEAAVVAALDGDGLVKPRAFVVRRANVTEIELQRHVKDRLAPYKYPRWVEFVDELPRTATGKVQRYLLRSGR
ncbi:MAG: benzoate-CoA ligase family protein, partial [Chloroflexota bacterium]